YDALRPGGQIILIDFHRIKGKSSDWVMGHVRAGQEVFVREILAAGFRKVGGEKLLKKNYFVRFREKEKQTEPTPRGLPFVEPKNESAVTSLCVTAKQFAACSSPASER